MHGRGVLAAVVTAVFVTAASACCAQEQPKTDAAAGTSVGGASPACTEPAATAADSDDLSAYEPVDMREFHTFRSYGGTGVQFSTCSGVRCRIWDPVASFQPWLGVSCWGKLPGLPADQNFAVISPYPVDRDTHEDFNGPAPSGRPTVNSFFDHTDLSKRDETNVSPYVFGPADYPLLAAGRKIVVPGSRSTPSSNDAVCAVGADTVVCELQNMWGRGERYGFRLAPGDSHTY